jgi:NAD(P)-dependent dehydrogenase (short-subunit alcohol dehydrogenase family)
VGRVALSRLAGKVAIVTGAASGIGAAAARAFAAEGAAVMGVDVDGERGSAVAEDIVRAGGRAAFRRCDVSADADVAETVAEAVARFGDIDVLFNNAGVMPGGSLLEHTLEEWERTMAINLRGVFLCSRHAVAAMGGSGSIVNTASPTALLGYPGLVAYSASKGGVLALTRALAVELAPAIRVNALVPGTTRTGILEGYLDTVADRERVLAAFDRQHPLGRIATPEDVAAAALYLASDDSAFVTGATLTVDGGLTIVKGNPD